MLLTQIKFKNNIQVRLPNWYKDDFIRIRKYGSSYVLEKWNAKKMELLKNYELTTEELLSNDWEEMN